MAFRPFDNDGSGEFDHFGHFDDDLFGGMERMFEQMRSMYGLDGRTGAGHGMGEGRGTYEGREAGVRGSAATSMEVVDGEYVFVMDLPGFELEDIDLTFDDGRLSVLAVHEAEDDSTRRSRRVRNGVHVPADVHAEDISATYRNGVLEVHLPIADEDDDGHHIDIQG